MRGCLRGEFGRTAYPAKPCGNRRTGATRGLTSPGYSQAMTVLSRGARVRRGGRRPGWVLLTALLVLAIGASSALVFTDRVELLKLAVLLALWAAVAGAFVSVLYRRQSDVDQARVRDLKLVYDLQLDREISARREYELTLESQLRRELASELRAPAADEVAALRAELAALRTSLEILFDADLEHRPALGTGEKEARAARALDGESPPADWVSSDRVMAVRGGDGASRTDEASIIDVPEVGVPPVSGGPRHYEAPPPPQPEPLFEPRHRPRRSRRNRSDQSGSRSPATGSGCLPKHLAASGHPSNPKPRRRPRRRGAGAAPGMPAQQTRPTIRPPTSSSRHNTVNPVAGRVIRRSTATMTSAAPVPGRVSVRRHLQWPRRRLLSPHAGTAPRTRRRMTPVVCMRGTR
ncbi:transmembrane protein [Mycobacterium tuberculosis variant microti]|nr:transmembrane protein [Mycobacterium tuberculosis variant bovis BCG]AMC61410.1 transmembrane protein [Mycobacterium tuberculosis variant microti]